MQQNHSQPNPVFCSIRSGLILPIILFLLFTYTESDAQSTFGQGIAVGIQAGTTGIGAEAATSIVPNLVLRTSIGKASGSSMQEIENDPSLDLDVQINITTFTLGVDYFPFKRYFKLSAGLVYNDFNLDATAIPNENYILNKGEDNEKVFNPDRLGSLSIGVNYPNKWNPYVGLGFGNMVGDGFPLKLTVNLGLLYSGPPELRMTGTGMIAPTVDQASNIQEGLDVFEWFPVFNIGLSYRIR